MIVTDTRDRYGLVSVVNHWLTVVLMLTLLVIGLQFEDLPRGPERAMLQDLHVSIGVAALLYFLFRLGWRANQGFPAPVAAAAGWQETAARLVHRLLMLDLLVLMVSGPLTPWSVAQPLSVFGLFALPSPLPRLPALHQVFEVVHKVAGKPVFFVLLGLHVLGVLKHAIIDRDATLRRMLWPA